MYDKKNKIWINHRKRVYLLWFKFLQHSERDETRQVDWTKYDGWGGVNEVLGAKFDAWWQEHWLECFGVKNRGDNPKFALSVKQPYFESLRVALLVYEYGIKFPKLNSEDLAIKIQKREGQKRFFLEVFDAYHEDSNEETKFMRKRISISRKKSREIMDNVCIGKFP